MTSKFAMTKDDLLSYLGNPAFRIPHLDHFEHFEDDKDVAIATVSRKGDFLHLFSNELRDDKDVVMAAVIQNPRSIRLAGTECRADKDIARQVLYNEKLTDVLCEFSNDIKNDYALIAGALPNVRSAGESIRGDKALMTEIIKVRPEQFVYSTRALMNDEEYCRLAISQMPRCVSCLHASHPLLRDRELALQSVNFHHDTLESFKPFQDDPQIVLAAYKREEWEYSPDNRNQKINTNDETVLQYASERIQKACEDNDPHKVLGAMALSEKLQAQMASKQESRRPSMKI